MRASSLAFLFLSPIVAFATVSPDATCGGEKGYTCVGSKWGDCCSQYGWCGKTTAYCLITKGCQSAFGSCTGLVSSAVSSASSGFRTSTSSRSSAAATPSSTQLVSVNARCGPSYGGRTCLGSKWGSCCSQYSYCGSTIDYCAADTCQKGYGLCNGVSSSSSSSMVSSTSQSSSTPAASPVSSSQSSSAVASSTPTSSPVFSSTTLQSSSSSVAPSSSTPSSSTAPTASTSSVLSSSSSSSTIILSTPSSTMGSSTSAPISSTATSSPQPTCGVWGNTNNAGSVTYFPAPPQAAQQYCFNFCSHYSSNGRSCVAYGYNADTMACTFVMSNVALAFNQIFTPATDGFFQWYMLSCDPTAVTPVASSSSAALNPSSVSSSSLAPSSSSTSNATPMPSPIVSSSSSALVSSSTSGPTATPTPSPIISSSTTPTPSPSLPTTTLTPSPIVSSSTATSATPMPTCDVNGIGKAGRPGSSILLKNTDKAACKTACQNYSANGNSCRIYSVYAASSLCYIYYGNPAPTIDQSVTPTTAEGLRWSDISCGTESLAASSPSSSSSSVAANTITPTLTPSPTPTQAVTVSAAAP